MLLLLVLLFVASVCLGSVSIDLIEALKAFFNGEKGSLEYRIVAYIRLPRALGAILAGAALAVSGVIIQAVLNNSLASPNIIGVNSGAGLGAIIVISLFPSAIAFMPIAAFVGAMAACLAVYLVSSETGAGRVTVALVGIAIGSIFSAGIDAFRMLFPDSAYDYSTFTVGGLGGMSYAKLSPSWIIIAVCLIIAIVFATKIDILSLGDEVAMGLGLNARAASVAFLMLAAALAGAAVSFAGLIGFVGLLVPHIIRRFVGGMHRILIPASALGGAILVLLCDLVSRLIFAPYELPVGIIMSLLGGPFFITLVILQRKRHYD